jgi:hypothetical protein
MQFQETGKCSAPKGAGTPNTSQEVVDRMQEAFPRSTQKSTRRDSLQLGTSIRQTTVWRVIHNRLDLHAY